MILKFKIFESLYESSNQESIISTVTSALKKEMGELYSVPDFRTFKREGEPLQTSILFADAKINTFSLNYAGNKLYSIDFWKPTSTKPDVTLYAKGEPLEDILPMIPKISKNPTPETELTEKKKTEKGPVLETPKEIKEEAIDEPEYKYGDPDTIFDDLRKYTKMVINGTQPSLLVTGMPGLGKSYNIEDEMKKAGLEKNKDWFHIKGKATAAGMYINLFQKNGKILVFDDCDSIFKDENAINVLKGALDSTPVREISWISAKPIKAPGGAAIPQNFDFTGQVIFISNLPQKKIDDAIKSRSFVIEIALSPEDMIKYIEELMPKIMPEVSIPIKRMALNTIKAVAKTVQTVKINLRTLIKSIKILMNVEEISDAKRMIIQQCGYQ